MVDSDDIITSHLVPMHGGRINEGLHELTLPLVHRVPCPSTSRVEPVGVDELEEGQNLIVIDMY